MSRRRMIKGREWMRRDSSRRARGVMSGTGSFADARPLTFLDPIG